MPPAAGAARHSAARRSSRHGHNFVVGDRGYDFSTGDHGFRVVRSAIRAAHGSAFAVGGAPPLQVVVPVQQLTPTAAYKWMALTVPDGGRVAADAAKLLGRLGRLQWLAFSLLT